MSLINLREIWRRIQNSAQIVGGKKKCWKALGLIWLMGKVWKMRKFCDKSRHWPLARIPKFDFQLEFPAETTMSDFRKPTGNLFIRRPSELFSHVFHLFVVVKNTPFEISSSEHIASIIVLWFRSSEWVKVVENCRLKSMINRISMGNIMIKLIQKSPI